jgi:hypothetical protein
LYHYSFGWVNLNFNTYFAAILGMIIAFSSCAGLALGSQIFEDSSYEPAIERTTEVGEISGCLEYPVKVTLRVLAPSYDDTIFVEASISSIVLENSTTISLITPRNVSLEEGFSKERIDLAVDSQIIKRWKLNFGSGFEWDIYCEVRSNGGNLIGSNSISISVIDGALKENSSMTSAHSLTGTSIAHAQNSILAMGSPSASNYSLSFVWQYYDQYRADRQ